MISVDLGLYCQINVGIVHLIVSKIYKNVSSVINLITYYNVMYDVIFIRPFRDLNSRKFDRRAAPRAG